MSEYYSVAREYGKALFLLTEELGTTERVRAEAAAVVGLFGENEGYTGLLDTPALTPDERTALIDEAFGTLDVNLVNLIKLMTKRSLAHMLPRTLMAYEDEYMESRGIVRAEAISAVALTAEQTEKLKCRLERITGKQIIIENKIDPKILGGIKLRYMGIQRDGSLRTRLDTFGRALRDAVI